MMKESTFINLMHNAALAKYEAAKCERESKFLCENQTLFLLAENLAKAELNFWKKEIKNIKVVGCGRRNLK